MTDYSFTTWFRRSLREYLLEHRISRNELARKLETTGATLHRYDRGLSFPDVGMQAKLAELFGVAEDQVARLVRESDKRRQREAVRLGEQHPGARRIDVQRKARRTAGKSWLGGLAHTGKIVGDIVSPAISAHEWEMLRPSRP